MDATTAKKAGDLVEKIRHQIILVTNMQTALSKLTEEDTLLGWHNGYTCFELKEYGINQALPLLLEAQDILMFMEKDLEALK